MRRACPPPSTPLLKRLGPVPLRPYTLRRRVPCRRGADPPDGRPLRRGASGLPIAAGDRTALIGLYAEAGDRNGPKAVAPPSFT